MGARLSLLFGPLARKPSRQSATQRSHKDHHEHPDASTQKDLQGARPLPHAGCSSPEALVLEAFLKLASSTSLNLDTGPATAALSISPGTPQSAATHNDNRVQLPAQKSERNLPADVQPDVKGGTGIPPDQATSGHKPSPPALSGVTDARSPTQAATESTGLLDEDATLPCSKMTCGQLKSVSQASSFILDWVAANMHVVAVQGRSQQMAAMLELAERHQREMQSLLGTLDQGLSNCNAMVMSLKTLPSGADSEVASRIPDLLRTGDRSLQPLQVQQCEATWRAVQMCLEIWSTTASSSSSSRVQSILIYLRHEMCWIKMFRAQVQADLKFLLGL